MQLLSCSRQFAVCLAGMSDWRFALWHLLQLCLLLVQCPSWFALVVQDCWQGVSPDQGGSQQAGWLI